MAIDKIKTIHEVRRTIDTIYDYLELANAHILDNSIDINDVDNLRKSWELCRELKCAKWTNQLL